MRLVHFITGFLLLFWLHSAGANAGGVHQRRCTQPDAAVRSKTMLKPEEVCKMKVSFFNALDRKITLYWVDGHGKEVEIASVGGSLPIDMNTYAGHAWRVRDKAVTGDPLVLLEYVVPTTAVSGVACDSVLKVDVVPCGASGSGVDGHSGAGPDEAVFTRKQLEKFKRVRHAQPVPLDSELLRSATTGDGPLPAEGTASAISTTKAGAVGTPEPELEPLSSCATELESLLSEEPSPGWRVRCSLRCAALCCVAFRSVAFFSRLGWF